MRTLYSLLIYLFTPLGLIYLALRGFRDRDYWRRWPERFGFFESKDVTGAIIVHAVSMGEVNACASLVREIRTRFPNSPLCLTSMTPTGSARIRSLFPEGVSHVYAPLDLPGAVKRFFKRVRPRLLIIMETEIWPNLYHEAHARNIPIIVVNARISDHSVKSYRRLRTLTSAALGCVSLVAAQSEQDAVRMTELGASKNRVSVTGNLKFDLDLPPGLRSQGAAIRQSWGSNRLVLTAGSTHEDDEIPLLSAFGALLDTFPSALLVLVPRHPERFGRAAQLARSAGLRVTTKSECAVCPGATQCYVIDSMGDLLTYYAACDVAFVGGSMGPVGGHNVLEPAALGKPVVIGPHTSTIRDIVHSLVENLGAVQVSDDQDLARTLRRLFQQPELRERMGQAGLGLVNSGRGAVQRTLELVKTLLEP